MGGVDIPSCTNAQELCLQSGSGVYIFQSSPGDLSFQASRYGGFKVPRASLTRLRTPAVSTPPPAPHSVGQGQVTDQLRFKSLEKQTLLLDGTTGIVPVPRAARLAMEGIVGTFFAIN